eukprot:jgi/Bigna1/142603/aug1.71_g17311
MDDTTQRDSVSSLKQKAHDDARESADEIKRIQVSIVEHQLRKKANEESLTKAKKKTRTLQRARQVALQLCNECVDQLSVTTVRVFNDACGLLALSPDSSYRQFLQKFLTYKRCDLSLLPLLTPKNIERYNFCFPSSTLAHEAATKALDHRSWLIFLGKLSLIDNCSVFHCLEKSYFGEQRRDGVDLYGDGDADDDHPVVKEKVGDIRRQEVGVRGKGGLGVKADWY